MSIGRLGPTRSHMLEQDEAERGCWASFQGLKLWQKIASVIVLLGVAVLSYFVVSRFIIPSPSTPPASNKQKAEFSKLVKGEYNPDVFNGTWISGTEFHYLDSYLNLVVYNCEDNSRIVVINRTEMIIDNGSFNFKFSADRQYLMYSTDYQIVFRRSSMAKYFILHLSTKKIIPLTNYSLLLALWAPQGNGIAYVSQDSNIWYRPNPENDTDIKVTASNDPSVFNGVPDWVYEEEILASNEAMWFSKDGSKLAFISFNDFGVPVYTIPIYGQPGVLAFQYPLQYPLHYPKVGKPNPTVQIQVADFSNIMSGGQLKLTNNYTAPASVQPEPIIFTIAWATNTEFLLIWFNRYQNVTSYCMCSTTSNNCEEKFVYKQRNGWIIQEVPIFDPKGERMVQVFPNDEGGNDFYKHVTLFDFTETVVAPTALTRGKIAVSEIAHWDTQEEIVYFISNVEGHPEQSQTSFVSSKIVNNETPSGKYTCLTCDTYKTIEGKPCLYSGSVFSTDASYYTVTCTGPYVPEATIFNKTHHPILLWESNTNLRQTMANTYIPEYTISDVPLDNNFTAKLYLNHPQLDSSTSKYPLLIRVYGGPESALVLEQFSFAFDKYYASTRNLYMASVDARGSGLRGSRNSFALNRKLGTFEVDDQITAIKYLINKYKNIDASRIGVWGWSYGGYVTGMMLSKDTENVIKCGLSVAPVTDWLLYDSMYTERYMGAPTGNDNYGGYVNSSLNRNVLGFKDKMYFLIHGTKDDNVHYQNSMLLARALEKNDIVFRQMTYPDEDHSMRSVYPHFYHSVQQFLDECFEINQD